MFKYCVNFSRVKITLVNRYNAAAEYSLPNYCMKLNKDWLYCLVLFVFSLCLFFLMKKNPPCFCKALEIPIRTHRRCIVNDHYFGNTMMWQMLSLLQGKLGSETENSLTRLLCIEATLCLVLWSLVQLCLPLNLWLYTSKPNSVFPLNILTA